MALGLLLVPSSAAYAQTTGAQVVSPLAPKDPTAPVVAQTAGTSGTAGTATASGATGASISLDLRDAEATGDGAGPGQIIVLVTLLAIGPAILMLVTSFTRIGIVLVLTRNALKLQVGLPKQGEIPLSP